MNLPALDAAASTDAELAIVLDRAADVLDTEGRRAVGACVFGVGTRMLITAEALRRSAAILAARPDLLIHANRAFEDARESLSALARFVWWRRERLEAYEIALSRALGAERQRDHSR